MGWGTLGSRDTIETRKNNRFPIETFHSINHNPFYYYDWPAIVLTA